MFLHVENSAKLLWLPPAEDNFEAVCQNIWDLTMCIKAMAIDYAFTKTLHYLFG